MLTKEHVAVLNKPSDQHWSQSKIINEVFNDVWAASVIHMLFCSCMLFVVAEAQTSVHQCCIYLFIWMSFVFERRGDHIA